MNISSKFRILKIMLKNSKIPNSFLFDASNRKFVLKRNESATIKNLDKYWDNMVKYTTN